MVELDNRMLLGAMRPDPVHIPSNPGTTEHTGSSSISEGTVPLISNGNGPRVNIVDGGDVNGSAHTETISVPQSPFITSKYTETSIKAMGQPAIMETPEEIMLRLSNDFDPIIERDADTLIYIGSPPRMAEQDDHEYRYIEQHFERPYLMHSTTLRKLGSAKFDQMLDLMSERTRRELTKLNVHRRVQTPDKIKYYIDMRPVIEEEEGMLLLSEMTSTLGVLNWARQGRDFGTPSELIDGVDKLNLPLRSIFGSIIGEGDQNGTPKSGSTGTAKRDELGNSSTREPFANPDKGPVQEQYSPLRHYSAIERLLQAAAGQDPKLNSAPKAWTFCAVSKYFDCSTNDNINKWLIAWLLAPHNVNFIQCNPEVAYKMAMNIHSPDILRCAFAVLVGEKTLARAEMEEIASTKHNQHRSVMSREMASIDDDDANRVDHAATSLLNRVRGLFGKLTSPTLDWTQLVAEKCKLIPREGASMEEALLLSSIRYKIVDYVRRKIFSILFMESEHVDDTVLPRGREARTRDHRGLSNHLEPRLRIYTRQPWIMLSDYGFCTDRDNQDWWGITQRCLIDREVIDKDDYINFVSKDDLFIAVVKYNKYLRQNHLQVFEGAALGAPSPDGMSFVPAQEAQQYNGRNRSSQPYSREYKIWKVDHESRPRSNVEDRSPAFHITDHANIVMEIDIKHAENLLPCFTYTRSRALLGQDDQGVSDANDGSMTGTQSNEAKPIQCPTTINPQTTATRLKAERKSSEPARAVPLQSTCNDQAPRSRPSKKLDKCKAGVSRRARLYDDRTRRELGLISMPEVLQELDVEFRHIIERNILMPGYVVDMTYRWHVPMTEINTLLCLNHDEWQYLPLWAGGLDDGSGDVFDDGADVPNAPSVEEGGFRGGPTGLVWGIPSEAQSQSMLDHEEFSDIGTEMGVTTVGAASRAAIDGTIAAGSTVVSLDE